MVCWRDFEKRDRKDATIVPSSTTVYREQGLATRWPEGLQEHQEDGITVIDIRYHVGRERTLAALAFSSVWLLFPLLRWWRGRQTFTESVVMGVAIFSLSFLLRHRMYRRQTLRVELLPDGVRVRDAEYPFADFWHFEVVPSGSTRSARRRLTSTSRSGGSVNIADGLRAAQAEYLRDRIAAAAEAARRLPTGR
jgi:hypothetical protein